MSSSSRNTRRADSAHRCRALCAGVALVSLSGAALADEAPRFIFTAYSDAAGGADVLAGRYRTALEELNAQSAATELDPAAAINTNRCVAYSMTLQWQEARAACDAAVHAAREQHGSLPSWMSWIGKSNEEYVALAYANRAVMDWLSSDDAAARRDLAEARRLLPRADFVAQNLAALKVHGMVAQTGAPASKS